MKQISVLIFMAIATQIKAAPQLISFNDGKLGVNFGGYHAAVGLGGATGSGAAGGLFAEAGTPHGQAARAGLGGAVDANGGTAGGLYAGATAGGNVKASAGLAGGVQSDTAAGSGYASAQAGNQYAASGLVGDAGANGATGYTFSGTKSFGVSNGVIKEKEVIVEPIPVKPINKKIHTEIKVDSSNEINAVPLSPVIHETKVYEKAKVNVHPAVLVKEVYTPPRVVEKHVIKTHYKPARHHYRKTAYIHGYVGEPVPPPVPVILKTVPVVEKRVDVESTNVGSVGEIDASAGGVGQVGYTKQVTIQRNPTFFADIFNIPISTLKAVGNFLGNAAGSTSVSVQKSATLQADSDLTAKHAPSSSSSSKEAHISVQTQPASSFIDDIFAIPINTLGAVNKFLENNVPAKKRVEISDDGTASNVKLGPHARRRANRRVIIHEDDAKENPEPTTVQ